MLRQIGILATRMASTLTGAAHGRTLQFQRVSNGMSQYMNVVFIVEIGGVHCHSISGLKGLACIRSWSGTVTTVHEATAQRTLIHSSFICASERRIFDNVAAFSIDFGRVNCRTDIVFVGLQLHLCWNHGRRQRGGTPTSAVVVGRHHRNVGGGVLDNIARHSGRRRCDGSRRENVAANLVRVGVAAAGVVNGSAASHFRRHGLACRHRSKLALRAHMRLPTSFVSKARRTILAPLCHFCLCLAFLHVLLTCTEI